MTAPVADADTPLAGLTLWRVLGVGLVAVVWALASHVASSSETPPAWGAVMALTPASIALALALWRLPRRWMAVGAIAVQLGLLLAAWPWLRTQAALLFLLEQMGVYLLLALFFGRTLKGPGESLVTQLARRVHGGVLSPAQLRYTRKVTVAWTLFFAGIALVSLLLFLFMPVLVWSTFANLLAGPLIGVMFMAEFLCRRLVLAGEDQATIADAIRAWKTHNASNAHKAP